MEWFKGNFKGKPHTKNGKIYGFRFQFSLVFYIPKNFLEDQKMVL